MTHEPAPTTPPPHSHLGVVALAFSPGAGDLLAVVTGDSDHTVRPGGGRGSKSHSCIAELLCFTALLQSVHDNPVNSASFGCLCAPDNKAPHTLTHAHTHTHTQLSIYDWRRGLLLASAPGASGLPPQVYGVAFSPYYAEQEAGVTRVTEAGDDAGDASDAGGDGGRHPLQLATWGVRHVKLWTLNWGEVRERWVCFALFSFQVVLAVTKR